MGRVRRWIRSAIQVFTTCIGVPAKPGSSQKYQEKKRRKKRSFRLWLFRRRGKGGSKTSLPRLPSGMSGSDTAFSLGESRDDAGGASKGIPKAVSHSSPHAATSRTGSSVSTSTDVCYNHHDICSTVPHTRKGNTPSTDDCHRCGYVSPPEKQTESTLSDYKRSELNSPNSTSPGSQSQVASSTKAHMKDQNHIASPTSRDSHIEDQCQVDGVTSSDPHIQDHRQTAGHASSVAHIKDEGHVASVTSTDPHIKDRRQTVRPTSSVVHIKDEGLVASGTSTDIHIEDTQPCHQIHVTKAIAATISGQQNCDAMPNDKPRKPHTSSSLTLFSLQGCSTTLGTPLHGSTSDYENKGKLYVDKFGGDKFEGQDIRGAKTPKRILNVKFKDKVKVMKVGTPHIQKVQELRNSDSVTTQPNKTFPFADDVSLKQDGNCTNVEQNPVLSGSLVYLSDAASEYLRYERSYNELSVYRSESPVSDVSDLPFDLEEKPRKGEHLYHTAHPSALSLVEPRTQCPEQGTVTALSATNEHPDVENFLSVQADRGFGHEVPRLPKASPRYQEHMNPDEGSILLPSKYESANKEDGDSKHSHGDSMNQDLEASDRLWPHTQRQVPTLHHESTVPYNATVSVRETCLHKGKNLDKVPGSFRYGGDLKEESQIMERLTKKKRNTEQGKLGKVLKSMYYSSALEWADQCYQLGKDETQQLLFDIYGKDYLTRNISQKSPCSTEEIPQTTRQKSSYFSSALEWADQSYQMGKDEIQQLLFDIYGKDYMTVGIPQKPGRRPHPSLDNSLECRHHGSVLGQLDTNQLIQEGHGLGPTIGEIHGNEQSTLDGMPSCLSCSRGLDTAFFQASDLQWKNQGSNFKTVETRRLPRAVCGHDYSNGETSQTQGQIRSWNKAAEELDAATHNLNPSHPITSCNTRKIRFSQKIVESRKQSAVCCGSVESGWSVLSRQKGIVSHDHVLSRKQVRSSPVRLSSRPKVRWSERKRQTLQEFSDELDYLEGLGGRRIGGDDGLYESKRYRKRKKKRKRESQ